MKRRQVFGVFAWIAGNVLLFVAILSGIYFLTGWIFQTIGYAPPLLLVQVLNTLLSVALFALHVLCLSLVNNARPRTVRQPMGMFEPIFAAMEQIARGDFQVRLEHRANPFANELAKSVNQMALELHQMEHLRQEFISNVSHDIQSPLTSIRGFAHVLHDEALSAAERSHYLTIIEGESMRLSRMTDNMLKLAALEVTDGQLDRQLYRLDKQIRSLILAAEPQWTGKAITIRSSAGRYRNLRQRRSAQPGVEQPPAKQHQIHSRGGQCARHGASIWRRHHLQDL